MNDFRSALLKILPRVLLILAIGTGLLPVVGWLGGGFWFLDLFNHFQHLYVGLLIPCALALALMKSFRSAAVAGLLLMVPLVRIVPGYLSPTAVPTDSTVVKIASFNVLASNRQHAATIQWVKETAPDAIFFTEVSDEWTTALKELEGVYPHFINDGPDMAFFSKFPIASREIHRVSEMRFPLLEAQLVTPGGTLTFFAGHPVPPLSPRWARALDDFVHALAGEITRENGRVVAVGDFNATRWSHKTRALADLGLREASQGHAPGATWMRGNPVFGIPIDRILFRGEGMGCRSFKIGPDLHSDHRPVVAELTW